MTRTVPSIAVQNPGTTVASALWNAGPKAIGDFYTGPPLFRGRQSSANGTVSGTWSTVTINTVDVDTDSGHATNSSRYVCQVAGMYYVQGAAAWTNSGSQSRIDCAIAYNGSVFIGSRQALIKQNGDLSAVTAAAFVPMKVGDYVETWAKQNTGLNLAFFIGSDLCPCLSAFWIHS